MAREKVLHAVYAAIASLRHDGKSVTIASVVQISGIARSTFYQDHPDWLTVMSVIDGAEIPSQFSVDVATLSPRPALSRMQLLTERVNALERSLKETVAISDDVFRRLIDQLQYYFALSHETPKRLEESRKSKLELAEAYQQITRLNGEIRRLSAFGKESNILSAKGHKRHIAIPADLSVARAVDHFLGALHLLIPDKVVGNVYSSIVFVCGLPLSGKSTWIDRQVARGPGTSLYIEGTLHTAEIRSLLLCHVRRLCEAEVRCVWMLVDLEWCLRRVESPQGRHSAELIKSINSTSELICVTEGFDSIVGVRP